MQTDHNPFTAISRELAEVKAQQKEILNLIRGTATSTTPADDKPLTIAEASEFLGIAKQTIYQRVAEIPHKKRFGRLYFYRQELADYLNAGRAYPNE